MELIHDFKYWSKWFMKNDLPCNIAGDQATAVPIWLSVKCWPCLCLQLWLLNYTVLTAEYHTNMVDSLNTLLTQTILLLDTRKPLEEVQMGNTIISVNILLFNRPPNLDYHSWNWLQQYFEAFIVGFLEIPLLTMSIWWKSQFYLNILSSSKWR